MDIPPIAEIHAFAEAVKEFKELYALLAADVESAVALIKSAPSGFADRTLVRTYFALIEGMTSKMCAIAINGERLAPGTFDDAELANLAGTKRCLNKWGELTEKGYCPGPIPLLIFSMNSFARAYRTSFSVQTRNGCHPVKGLDSLRKFTVVRNDITHPDDIAKFQIAPGSRDAGNAAAEWLRGELNRMLQMTSEAAPALDQETRLP